MATKRQKLILSENWRARGSLKGPLPSNFFTMPEIADDWPETSLPHNWAIDNQIGPLENITYYFNRFNVQLPENFRAFLILRNVFNLFTLYVNGREVYSGSSYFVSHRINIAEYLEDGENFLFLKVSWPLSSSEDPMIGVYKDFEYNENLNCGGLCSIPEIEIQSQVFVNALSLDYTLFDLTYADIHIKSSLNSEEDIAARFNWSLEPFNFDGEKFSGEEPLNLWRGRNFFDKHLLTGELKLWWPLEQGWSHLYRLVLKVTHEEDVLLEHKQIMGFRTVEMLKDGFRINGQRQFIRGVHYLPQSNYMSRITRESLEKDIQLILDAGFNAIRLFQNVASTEFYDICNENGLMIFQDVPYNHAASLKEDKEVLKKVGLLQKQLQHHPAIVAYWAPSSFDMKFFRLGKIHPRHGLALRIFAQMMRSEPSRPILLSSNYYSIFRLLDWEFAASNRFKEFQGAWSRIGKSQGRSNIITSYGFPAYPEIATMIKMSVGLDEEVAATWSGNEDKRNYQHNMMESYVSKYEFKRAPLYYLATQHFQSNLLRFYSELWRRYKYTSYNGCFVYFFKDMENLVSDSLIDFYGRQKQSYQGIKNAMKPVTVMMDWPSETYRFGDEIKLDIYVINDTRHKFPSTIMECTILNADNEEIMRNRKIVDFEGDDIRKAATLSYYVDENMPSGFYQVNLELLLPTAEKLSNSYRLQVVE